MGALMQPTGREVSREGFDDVRRSGRAAHQKQLILTYIRAHGPSTRNEIHERTGIPLASVCGRCNALLDLKLLDVVGTVGKPGRQVLGLTDQGLEQLRAQGPSTSQEATQ